LPKTRLKGADAAPKSLGSGPDALPELACCATRNVLNLA